VERSASEVACPPVLFVAVAFVLVASFRGAWRWCIVECWLCFGCRRRTAKLNNNFGCPPSRVRVCACAVSSWESVACARVLNHTHEVRRAHNPWETNLGTPYMYPCSRRVLPKLGDVVSCDVLCFLLSAMWSARGLASIHMGSKPAVQVPTTTGCGHAKERKHERQANYASALALVARV